MKSIIIYYSLEGNTEYVANQIAKNLGADTLRIKPKKEYPTGGASKFVWGGKSVIFGEKPTLEDYVFNAKDYDQVIIGTPIWAGTFAPPIKTFLHENQLSDKRLAFVACSGGGDTKKCFQKLEKEIGSQNVVATLSLVDPGKKQLEVNELKIKNFCDEIKKVK